VETVEALSRIIQQKEEGERIEIEFLRDKKKKKVEVEVAEEESSFDAWFNLETSPHFRQRLSRWSKQVQKVSQETMSQLRKKMADINRRAEENMIELSRKLKELSRENIFQPQIAGDKKFRGLRV